MNSTQTPDFVQQWIRTVSPATLNDLVPDPARGAFFSADLINGFVHEGPLASPRVKSIVGKVVDLFHHGWDYGIREFVLFQDTHHPDTPEFNAYPPHALRGDSESETIPELASLPFGDRMTIIEKNSLNPAIETTFDDWWDAHRDINRAIVVGDCTDLCVYQLAMHLRLRANALNLDDFDVIVPANVVQTFDFPIDPDQPGSAHPGDFFHDVFLYHMASNGIRVVSTIAAPDHTAGEGASAS